MDILWNYTQSNYINVFLKYNYQSLELFFLLHNLTSENKSRSPNNELTTVKWGGTYCVLTPSSSRAMSSEACKIIVNKCTVLVSTNKLHTLSLQNHVADQFNAQFRSKHKFNQCTIIICYYNRYSSTCILYLSWKGSQSWKILFIVFFGFKLHLWNHPWQFQLRSLQIYQRKQVAIWK